MSYAMICLLDFYFALAIMSDIVADSTNAKLRSRKRRRKKKEERERRKEEEEAEGVKG